MALILVPPSEGKTAPDAGSPYDPAALAFAETLSPVRQRMIAALSACSSGDEVDALKRLKLGPRSGAELVRNRELPVAPAAPAARLYTGVLFDRLGLTDLSRTARRRADERLLIFSALWGVVRPGDRIPPYRFPAAARLPGMPSSRQVWRDALTAVLPSDELAVDVRSAPYRELWRGPAAGVTLRVDVVRERRGKRITVSHNAKAARGAVVRALLHDAAVWRRNATAEAVVERIAAAGWSVELGRPDRHGVAHVTVVERG